MMIPLAAVLCFAVACGLLVAVYGKLEHLSDCLDCLREQEEEPRRQREEMDSLSDYLEKLHHMGEVRRKVQSLKWRQDQLEEGRKTLEKVLERCQNYASLIDWVWTDDVLYEKTLTLPEWMNEESLFVEETGYLQMEEVAGDFETLLDEWKFEEELQLKEGLELERQVDEKEHLTERRDEDERRLASLFFQWLCENKGIVLARELEEKLHGNTRSMEKKEERAVDYGFELSPKLSEAQGLKEELSSQTENFKRRNEDTEYTSIKKEMEFGNLEARGEQKVRLEELVAADEGRLEDLLQDVTGPPDRSCGSGNCLVTETEKIVEVRKMIQDLKRHVQCLRDIMAHQEERLEEERGKNENLENLIVELGGENQRLHYQVATRDAVVVELKRKNATLCEEVLMLRNMVAELEDAELKGNWQPFIWGLPLACFMLLWKRLPFFTRPNYGGDELGEGGDELTRIN
ncbi:golgin subfamily A member 6-like protein 1 [Macrobrachium rosenbergii]|uniref:golgin subfamily A member 6-like protein 1 n=1 Tax=Macrobrachium rosenbergii TaxID=79674 RepID=UPI0034D5ACE4